MYMFGIQIMYKIESNHVHDRWLNMYMIVLR